MKEFKFFQKGTLSDLQMLDEDVRATASFYAPTPEGVMGRRMLYHTNRDLYDRLTGNRNNFQNEMEGTWHRDNYGNAENMTRIQRLRIEDEERAYRIHSRLEEESRRVIERERESIRRLEGRLGEPLFPKITVRRVDNKWLTKFNNRIKDAWNLRSVSGTIILATTITLSVIAIISKILNVW